MPWFEGLSQVAREYMTGRWVGKRMNTTIKDVDLIKIMEKYLIGALISLVYEYVGCFVTLREANFILDHIGQAAIIHMNNSRRLSIGKCLTERKNASLKVACGYAGCCGYFGCMENLTWFKQDKEDVVWDISDLDSWCCFKLDEGDNAGVKEGSCMTVLASQRKVRVAYDNMQKSELFAVMFSRNIAKVYDVAVCIRVLGSWSLTFKLKDGSDFYFILMTSRGAALAREHRKTATGDSDHEVIKVISGRHLPIKMRGSCMRCFISLSDLVLIKRKYCNNLDDIASEGL